MRNVIELQGVNFTNKGGELMGIAILDHFSSKASYLRFSVPLTSSFSLRRKILGISRLMYFQRERFLGMNRILDLFVRLVPNLIRDFAGITRPSDIRIILDASGFRYSDQWGVETTITSAVYAQRMQSKGVPYILLPQAFGPFESQKSKSAIKQLIEACDLAFARDAVSFDHLQTAGVDMQKVHLAPDFTNLVNPGALELSPTTGKVVIVPNSRMLDKTGSSTARGYLPLLIQLIKVSREYGFEPVLLVHDEKEDMEIAAELVKVDNGLINIVSDRDPIVLKGLLADAQLVVTSRFHAAVGALSCGVPTVCIGWSHKYHELMSDYGVREYSLNMDEDEVCEKLEKLLSPIEMARVKSIVINNAIMQKTRTKEMWAKVDGILSGS